MAPTLNYRESYGMYACNGILLNHHSPRCGEIFVSRKITRGLANISQGLEQCLYMGNPRQAKIALGWEPRTTVDEMIVEMVDSDLRIACRQRLLLKSGYDVNTTREW